MSTDSIDVISAPLSSFNGKKSQLHDYIGKALNIAKSLGLSGEVQKLEKTLSQLDGDSFKTLIIGEFKRGKSTFINALLGQDVLPAYAIPCTAVINEVKYGPEKKAILHFTNPFPESTPYELAPDVQKHIDAHRAEGEIPPMEIPADRVEEFVVIPDPGKDQAQSVFESPYKKVELFWPLPLLKNNVEIIDSPGLNEHKSRTQVTTDYLGQADAIIFVMTCSALASASEMDVVDNTLRRNGYEDLFFICNRFDEVRQAERDRVVSFAHKKLDSKTELSNGIQFVSSANALDAKIAGDAEKLNESGFVELEKNLSAFLIDNRGRLKLIKPSKDLRKFINDALLDFIPNKEKTLSQSLAQLEENAKKAEPQLKNAELNRDKAILKIEKIRERIKNEAGNKFEDFLRAQSTKIKEWLDSYELKSSLKLLSTTFVTEQAKAIIQECSEHVGQCMEKAQMEWEDNTFKPFLEEQLNTISDDIQTNLEDFYEDISGAKLSITGESENVGVRNIGVMERVLSAAGGWFLCGPGSAAVGAVLGYKEMFKSLIPSIAIIAASAVFGFFNPLILIPLLLTAGGIQALFSMKGATKKIKDKTAENIANEIQSHADENGKALGQAVFEKTQAIQDAIQAGMNNEIQAVKDTIDSARAVLQQGEFETQQKKEELDNNRSTLRTLLDSVNDFIDNA